MFFFFNDTATTEIYTLSLHDALPIFFLAGLAVSVAFRMGLFNIGVEGQYRLATILAAGVGAAVVLPGPLHVLLIVVVAMVVGALWAGIVGVLKVTREIGRASCRERV